MRSSSKDLPASPRRRRPIPLAAVAVTLLAATAAGCGNAGGSPAAPASGSTPPASTGTGQPSATNPAPSATSGPPQSAPGTAPPGTTSPAGPASPNAVSARCTVTELRMRLGAGDPGAGNIYYPLRFTNTGHRTCTLDGFPGVSLIRGDGSVIGRPAARQGSGGSTVRLAPGATVEADLHTLNQGIKDGGCWRKPTFLKAYPPGSTDAMTLATAAPVVCGDTFDVGAIH